MLTPIQVSVSKSALGIFYSMFPSRTSEEVLQKSIRWDSFVLAMGKRLRKWLRWTNETFVLEKKKKELSKRTS